MRIEGSTVVVTGGASGIGAQCVRMMHRNGAKVAIWDMNENNGQAMVSELSSNTVFCKVDVTDTSSIEAAIQQTIQQFGEIHALINCAGIIHAELTVSKQGPHRLETFQNVIRVNLIGAFNVSRLVSRQMAQQQGYGDYQERGVIIHMASVAGIEGMKGQVAYSASKGGVIGMTLPMARDLAHFKIRVVSLAPGIIETPMGDLVDNKVGQALIQQTPLGRLGKPEEVAHLAKSVIENEYINGTTLRIDAGLRLPNL